MAKPSHCGLAVYSALRPIQRVQETAASKDIDFVGGQKIVKHVAVLLGGDVKLATMDDHATPNSGVILFKDSEGYERQLDFLDAPAGLRMDDVLETARLFEVPESPGWRAAVSPLGDSPRAAVRESGRESLYPR